MSDVKVRKKSIKVKTTKVKKSSKDGATPKAKKSPKKSAKTPKEKDDKKTKVKKTKKASAGDGGDTPKSSKKKTSKSTKTAKGKTAIKTAAKKVAKSSKGKKGADSPKGKKKKKKPKEVAAPEVPKVDPEIRRRELRAQISEIRTDIAKQKRLTARGEVELESLKRNLCINKAMQSHINDATLREHDELIEDMIDTLYEYEERVEEFEVLAESFAENFEDGKADLGFDLEAQGRLYAEHEQMLQEFADEVTQNKEKYTEEIGRASCRERV